jgi:hypothetical protein
MSITGATVCGAGAWLTAMLALLVSLKRHGHELLAKAQRNPQR